MDLIDYYKQVNRFTVITNEKWLINKLYFNTEFLFDAVKSILIHPIDAKRLRVKYNRRGSKIFHAENTTVETILSYDKLKPFFKNKEMPLKTEPSDRAVLSCDHHALLFCSFVRHLNIPCRVRTGFAKYIVKNRLIPHWITEIYDEKSGRWVFIDPERRIIDIDRNSFIFAYQIWLEYINNPSLRIVSYSGLHGAQGLKYALLCDLNSIFKNELLGYEWRLKSFGKTKPEIARISYERMNEKMKKDINYIAELMKNPDENINRLFELGKKYISDYEFEINIINKNIIS